MRTFKNLEEIGKTWKNFEKVTGNPDLTFFLYWVLLLINIKMELSNKSKDYIEFKIILFCYILHFN